MDTNNTSVVERGPLTPGEPPAGLAPPVQTLVKPRRRLVRPTLFALLPLALLIAMRPYLRLSAVTLVVVVLVPGTGTPFVRPFDRVTEILLGTLAAIIVAAIIRPRLWRKAIMRELS